MINDIAQYVQSIYFLYYLLITSVLVFLYYQGFGRKKPRKKTVPSIDIKALEQRVIRNDRKFQAFNIHGGKW
jgi:hypothetical protein